MSPTPIQQSVSELSELNQRRQKLADETDELDRDLADAIERARTARLSMREIAEHAGVERSTLYSALNRAKQPAQPTDGR